jgi:phosphoribosylanthranilate isomerase
MEQVLPFGVDASSRLESSPGVKDPDRVRRFVAAVRRHDATRDA